MSVNSPAWAGLGGFRGDRRPHLGLVGRRPGSMRQGGARHPSGVCPFLSPPGALQCTPAAFHSQVGVLWAGAETPDWTE